MLNVESKQSTKYKHKIVQYYRLPITLFLLCMNLLFMGAGVSQAQAQANLVYNTVSLVTACDTIMVYYTITNGNPLGSSMEVYNANTNAYLGGQDIQTTDGTHSATINITPMSNGQQYIIRTLLGGQTFNSGVGTCGGGGGTTNPPTGGGGGTTPPTNNPSNPSVPSAPTWSGLTDGRLNPDPAEAYTVFCAYDRIFVHGDEPTRTTRLVAIIDIEGIMALPDGGQVTLPEMTITRNGNTITISGTNGYYTPQLRSKTFDFTECLLRNSQNGGSYDANGQPLSPQTPQNNNRPPIRQMIACGENSTHPICVAARSRRRGSGGGPIVHHFP